MTRLADVSIKEYVPKSVSRCVASPISSERELPSAKPVKQGGLLRKPHLKNMTSLVRESWKDIAYFMNLRNCRQQVAPLEPEVLSLLQRLHSHEGEKPQHFGGAATGKQHSTTHGNVAHRIFVEQRLALPCGGVELSTLD